MASHARPRKTLLAGLAAVVLGIGAGTAVSACGDDDTETTTVTAPAAATTTTAPTTTTTATTSTSTTSTSTGEDISGNCDEAEHADDPECAGSGSGGIEAGDDSGY